MKRIIIELIDGQVYVATNLTEPVEVTVHDYDTAEHVSIEAALKHKPDVAHTGLAIAGAIEQWEWYLRDHGKDIDL